MTTPDLTDVLARLDRRVADAAEAWLTDPRDTGVYARLVAAVTERRHVLDAVASATPRALPDGAAPVEPVVPVVPDVPDAGQPGDEAAGEQEAGEQEPDEDAEPAVPLRPVGADLVGDPRAVLERLRRG